MLCDCSSEKGVPGIAMKIETLLLAVLSQLWQVGIRNSHQVISEPSSRSSSSVFHNLTYECHCHCTHESVTQIHWETGLIALAGVLVGRASVGARVNPPGIPSPRRRGHGVLVEHSAWHSSGCVLH